MGTGTNFFGSENMMNISLLDDLKWRYATEKINGQTVPKDKLNYILKAAQPAPSSCPFIVKVYFFLR